MRRGIGSDRYGPPGLAKTPAVHRRPPAQVLHAFSALAVVSIGLLSIASPVRNKCVQERTAQVTATEKTPTAPSLYWFGISF